MKTTEMSKLLLPLGPIYEVALVGDLGQPVSYRVALLGQVHREKGYSLRNPSWFEAVSLSVPRSRDKCLVTIFSYMLCRKKSISLFSCFHTGAGQLGTRTCREPRSRSFTDIYLRITSPFNSPASPIPSHIGTELRLLPTPPVHKCPRYMIGALILSTDKIMSTPRSIQRSVHAVNVVRDASTGQATAYRT